jgi:16S rRNA (uracil1498-N3)-methyltransferase
MGVVLAEVAEDAGGAVLAIGPEGAHSDRERELLEAAGFVGAGLGPRVLKAETAAIAAIVLCQSAVGDMGEGDAG